MRPDPCVIPTQTHLQWRPQNHQGSPISFLPLNFHHQTKLNALLPSFVLPLRLRGGPQGVEDPLTGTQGYLQGMKPSNL